MQWCPNGLSEERPFAAIGRHPTMLQLQPAKPTFAAIAKSSAVRTQGVRDLCAIRPIPSKERFRLNAGMAKTRLRRKYIGVLK